MTAATARREALTSELAALTLRRDASALRVVRDAPAALSTLREELAARISRTHALLGALARSVLVVDDHADLAELTAEALCLALRVPVYVAHSAAEALAVWRRHRCGAVVADLYLPDGSGDEVVRAIGDVGVRSVIVSGVADLATLNAAARRCGAVAMRKPADGLVEVVRGKLDAVCPPLWCRATRDAIVDVSPDLARLIGRPAHALRGVPWRALVHPDDVARSEAERARRIGQGVEGFVQRMRRADGSYVALAWDVAPMVDGVLCAVARVVG